MFNKIPTNLEKASIQTLHHDLAKVRGSASILDPNSRMSVKAALIEAEITRRGKPVPGVNNCPPSSNCPRQPVNPKGQ